MINQAICEALATESGYQCAVQLMRQQMIALLLVIYLPYLTFLLLFLARAKFKKNAFLEILTIAGIPLFLSIIFLLLFPYMINAI